MPILIGERVYWILNVEDSQQNAFAKEEQEGLEGVLKEVAMVLELAARTRIFTELLQHSHDSVIQTDFQGMIVQTNPATTRLLGFSEDEMKDTAFATYFKDRDQAQLVQAADYVPNEEVHLLRKDRSEASLLLSGTPLALGSLWGFLPLAAMIPFLVWRLLDEERFLARNLSGYPEYQRRVRRRLVPFVW